MTPRELRRLFKQARRDFFPRWDRQRLWKLRCVTDYNGALGEANWEDRTITIVTDQTPMDTYLVLIHELCHAATHSHHGKRWQERLAMAARHARQRGMLTLARHLREEIVAYRGPARDCYASAIYRRISKAMRESPEAKFPEVVDSLRRDYGMSRRDFVGRYRRARAVFDQARSSVLQYSAAVAYRKGHRAARTRRGQSS